MSETPSEAARAKGPSGGSVPGRAPQEAKRNIFSRIALFVRQVVAELKKVVAPTRSELFTYTVVVIVFVVIVMAFVTLIDFLIGKGVMWVFGG